MHSAHVLPSVDSYVACRRWAHALLVLLPAACDARRYSLAALMLYVEFQQLVSCSAPCRVPDVSTAAATQTLESCCSKSSLLRIVQRLTTLGWMCAGREISSDACWSIADITKAILYSSPMPQSEQLNCTTSRIRWVPQPHLMMDRHLTEIEGQLHRGASVGLHSSVV